jgi:hypothetical protein
MERMQDETLSTLAAEFAQMAAQVQERKEELPIAIDESKRKEDVEEILDSEFYLDLKEKAKNMMKRKRG